VLDYDHEAASYDASRGSDARADAAASAVLELLPPGAEAIVDVGCGTGIVSTRLRASGRRVVGIDRAEGMLRIAATRLPAGVVRGDATRLPLRDASCDAVVLIWVLHLLDDDASARVVAEAARVLGPAGTLITTVDKSAANLETDTDVAEIIAPVRAVFASRQSDSPDKIARWGAAHGLVPTAQTTFVGHGLGRSPRVWRDRILAYSWSSKLSRAELVRVREALAGLPDQDRPRADPIYRAIALSSAA
jgi:ubiquinone/menaquinone biosynthesis C-methylase UbiE